MEDNDVALVLIILGVILFYYGSRQFSKKDGRTKTGYKNNVLPKTGKGIRFIILGILIALIGFAGF